MGEVLNLKRTGSHPKRLPRSLVMAGPALAVAVAALVVPIVSRLASAPPQDSDVSAFISNDGSYAAAFTSCPSGGGTNCVVDGDTFWFHGEKYRLADIDAPETHPPRCSAEAALGNRATDRLQALLNDGAFQLRPANRETDRYGRKLRIVMRDGQSLGGILISEGLARGWIGYREAWC